MSESFSGSMKVNVQGTLLGTAVIGNSNYNLNYTQAYNLLNGTGAGQADIIYANTYTIAASGTQLLTLQGSLVDAHGATITFTSIKGMFIYAYPTNTNNVLVGGAASNAFASWCNASTDTITVRPGGMFSLMANDAVSYAVTGSTDVLQLANSSSGTGVQCDIILIGVQ